MRIVLAAAAALCAAAALASDGAAARDPTLRLVMKAPLTFRGAGFEGGERVTLRVVSDGGAATKRVRASATGVLVVRFARVTPRDPCTISAFAEGAAGSRASWELPERLCPMPLAPTP